ncbi:MAG: hypothetical protein ACFCD0_24550, partial [Gemmataceae bacterium]
VGAQGAVLQIVFELVDVVHTLWISNGAEFGKRDFHRLDSYIRPCVSGAIVFEAEWKQDGKQKIRVLTSDDVRELGRG